VTGSTKEKNGKVNRMVILYSSQLTRWLVCFVAQCRTLQNKHSITNQITHIPLPPIFVPADFRRTIILRPFREKQLVLFYSLLFCSLNFVFETLKPKSLENKFHALYLKLDGSLKGRDHEMDINFAGQK
jgi:hypothetical protein